MLSPDSVPTGARWLITLAFVALIIVLSVTPARSQAGDSIFVWLVVNTATPLQKALHVAVYASLAGLLMWTLANVERQSVRVLTTLMLSIGLGIVLEWLQTQVPGRFGTLADMALNAIGAIVGVVLALVLF